MSYRPAEPLANPARSYAVRISYSHGDIPADFWNAVSALGFLFATAHEDTATPHVHLAVWNVTVSHDNFRKRLREFVFTHIAEDHPEGNALMSVKKWKDGSEKYLAYMLKGNRHPVVWNSIELNDFYIKYLRDLWVEGEQEQTTAYKAWSLCPNFPKKIVYSREQMYNEYGELQDLPPVPEITFDTIVKSAKKFVLDRQKKISVDSAVRFLAKDLISNYCHNNDFKMGPVYI